MKVRVGLIAGVMVLMTAALHGQDGAAWKEFTAKAEGFRVLFPGKPQRQEKELGTATSKGKQVMYVLPADGANGYVAMWHSFPKDSVEGRDVDQMLDAGRDGGLGAVNGKLQSEKKIKLNNKYPGREWRFVAGEGTTHFRWRAYWVKPNMLYHVAVAGSKEFLDTAEAEKFLGSLQILNQDK